MLMFFLEDFTETSRNIPFKVTQKEKAAPRPRDDQSANPKGFCGSAQMVENLKNLVRKSRFFPYGRTLDFPLFFGEIQRGYKGYSQNLP